MATISTGDHYELWWAGAGGSWTWVGVPLEPWTASDHTMMVAAGGGLLVADAGDGGHVWAGELPDR